MYYIAETDKSFEQAATGGLLNSFAAGALYADTPKVAVLDVEGVINPVVAGYVERGIELSEDMDAVACIIQMDTPGGLDSSMRDIVQSIMEAHRGAIWVESDEGKGSVFSVWFPLRPTESGSGAFSIRRLKDPDTMDSGE